LPLRGRCTAPKGWLRDLWTASVSGRFPSPFLYEKTGRARLDRAFCGIPEHSSPRRRLRVGISLASGVKPQKHEQYL